MKKDLKELLKLYIQERRYFPWLISFEEFKRDYVVKCQYCNEYFVSEMDCVLCNNCIEYLEQENKIEKDYDWIYYDNNKEHFIYNIY